MHVSHIILVEDSLNVAKSLQNDLITSKNFSLRFLSSNHYGPVKGRASNNAAEIQAATWAINEAAYMNIDQLKIMTDSQFLISAVYEWMPQWKRNGWCRNNGMKLANEKDFRFLDRAFQRNFDMDIEFEHVWSHSGNCYNELADQLAKDGADIYYDMHFY